MSKRYIIKLVFDVHANTEEDAVRLARLMAANRTDSYDVEIEPFDEPESQASKHADEGYMNDTRFGPPED